jgi:hypothetical protein
MMDKIINAHFIKTIESGNAVTIDVSGHAPNGDEPIDAMVGNLVSAPID